MLGLGAYGSDSEEEEEEEDVQEPAMAPARVVMPPIAQALANASSDEDSDDDAPAAKKATRRDDDHEETGGSLLPSVDEALDAAAVPSFLQRPGDAAPELYGNILDEPEPEPEERPPVPAGGAAEASEERRPTVVLPSTDGREKPSETTRQKNARKEKLGQATFSLKWDRDTGAEKAREGLSSSSDLRSRTVPNAGKGRGGKDDEKLSMKDRTKEKRKRDQSASFLGGRWKSEEEMHMRDHFDS